MVFQTPSAIFKSRSKWQTQVSNLQCPPKTKIRQRYQTEYRIYLISQIAQPQNQPSPPIPTPFQSSQFRVHHFEVNLPGWGEHYYQPEVLLLSLLLLHCTQVSHFILSRHKKCSYLAPIRYIDLNFFGFRR